MAYYKPHYQSYRTKTKKSSATELQDILDQIMSKTERLEMADKMPKIDMPKADDIGTLSKIGNALSTGQKVTAKTVRDLMMEGQLPDWNEIKDVANINKEYSYREILKELGMQDNFGTKALGLGLDIFADPTNLIPLGAVGKIIGKGSKAAEAIPLIGKGFKGLNKAAGSVANMVRQARALAPFLDEGANKIYARSMGLTSEQGALTKELVEKYPDVYKNLDKLRPDRFNLIDEAAERFGTKEFRRMMADMSPEEQAFTKAWHALKKETGIEKLNMGTVKGLIGGKPQSTLGDIPEKLYRGVKKGYPNTGGQAGSWVTSDYATAQKYAGEGGKVIEVPVSEELLSKLITPGYRTENGVKQFQGQLGYNDAKLLGMDNFNVAQAPKPQSTVGVKQLPLFGQVDNTDDIVEELSYNPHYLTDEFRRFLGEQSGNPDEMRRVMSGMVKKNIYTKEKSRTMMGTINELNLASMEKHGIKMFEDDPRKIVANYTYAYTKKKAQYELIQDAMKVNDDLGNPIIKRITDDKVSDGMVKLTGLPFKEGFETTPEVAKMLNRVNGVFASDEIMNKFLKWYDRGLKIFKTSVTMPWPSFNANNLMGAMFNNFIYDAKTITDFPSTLMSALFKKPMMLRPKNGAALPLAEFRREMAKRGALNTFMNVETISGGVDNALSKVKALKPVQKVTGLPNNIEELVRLNLGKTVYEKTGSLEKAAKAIWEVHGNYSPEFLPKFEKEVMARVFPFWRWMRTSIPFQLENLYNKTGKYAAIAKAQNAVVSQEDRKNMPDYMKNQLLISKTEKDGKVSTRSWQAPFMDLQKLLSAREMASGLSPAIKVPAELTFNKELFTDREIEDKSLPPEMRKTILSKNDPLSVMPFAESVQKKNKITDEWEDRKQVNSKLAYILKNLGPISSLAATSKRASKEMEAQGIDTDAATKIWGILQGAVLPTRIQNYSKEEQEYYQAQALNAKLQEIINYLLQRNLIERKK